MLILGLVSWSLFFGGIWLAVWLHLTVAELRRGQRQIQADIIKIGAAVGLTLGPALIVCHHCGAEYDAELTGCTVCGKAKLASSSPRAPAGRAG